MLGETLFFLCASPFDNCTLRKIVADKSLCIMYLAIRQLYIPLAHTLPNYPTHPAQC